MAENLHSDRVPVTVATVPPSSFYGARASAFVVVVVVVLPVLLISEGCGPPF